MKKKTITNNEKNIIIYLVWMLAFKFIITLIDGYVCDYFD